MRVAAVAVVAILVPGAASADAGACQDIARPLRAIAACTAEIKKGGDVAWALNNRALARERAGDPLGAFADFDRAIAESPDFAPAWNNRGTLHARLGSLLEALADHERALALEPDYVAARHNRAVDLEELGRYAEALDAYRAVSTAAPDHLGSRLGQASASCKLGRVNASAEARLGALADGLLDARTLQIRLRDEGFYRGPIDGLFGKGSRAALGAWTRAGCLPGA